MATAHGPGYSALSKGRYSAIGEQYFLTFNLVRPQQGLSEPAIIALIERETIRLTELGCWERRISVVMPDHIHFLVRLRDTTPLGGVIRAFKGRLAGALRERGLRWQPSFYDHRLRHGEDALPIFLYIFLNPYRAGLVRPGEIWPGCICAEEDWGWFRTLTNEGTPFPEWLAER